LAININRDYVYESDIRALNKDGFGKYKEQAFAFPIGIGALLKITDGLDVKLGMQYYFTTTDYIDGITNKSVGNRAGTKQKDNFVYTSFALQYDLVFKKRTDTLPDDYFSDVNWLAIGNDDFDGDGVSDLKDKCNGTPKGSKVDTLGCPFDDDNDLVPNCLDDELASPAGFEVNKHGVALTDDYWQNWYNQYMDSGNIVKTEILENYYKKHKENSTIDASKEQLYTVELARYFGPVPNAEMAYLLSVGDVKSTLLPDNSTVLYTAGTYKEIQNAVKRREQFIKDGNNNAKVGYFKDGTILTLNDDEINKIIEDNKAKESLSSADKTTANNAHDNEENQFAPGEIVYRVQLGAYKNKISKELFKNAGPIVELKTDDNFYRYATKGFRTIQGAAELKATLVVEGYGDAFIAAFKDSKRIPLSDTKATMETKEKEDITSVESFSSIDKSLVTFKIQLGVLRKNGAGDMEEKIKGIKDVEKQGTNFGLIRYTSGNFNNYAKAEKYLQELTNKGFNEAFVIALFKGEVISIQEAKELLK
jgi:hypothetical protein